MSMRKNDAEMVACIRDRRNRGIGRGTMVDSHTTSDGDEIVHVRLHGNHIATIVYRGNAVTGWFLTTCGWNTQTTLRRLNAIIQNVCGYPLGSFRIVDGDTHLFHDGADMGPFVAINGTDYRDLLKSKGVE